MILMRPELVVTTADITSGSKFKSFKHPIAPAFLRSLYGFNDMGCCKPFKISYNRWQVPIPCTQNCVDMICHNHVCPYLEPFSFTTKIKTLQCNVPVFLPGKYIYPVNDLECQKVGMQRCFDLVSCGHAGKIFLYGKIIRLSYVSIRK